MNSPRVSDHAVLRVLLTRLRDHRTGAAEFRDLVHAVTSLLLHEALADLPVTPQPVPTPLTVAPGWRFASGVAFVPILRAGLGMADAVQRTIPGAEIWHLGMSRDEVSLRPRLYSDHIPAQHVAGTIAVILDPMLATGGSAGMAIERLKSAGVAAVRFVGILGTPEGVRSLITAHPDVPIFLAAVDERLSGPGDPWPPGYVVPGLGDAGDRMFGTA
jgi:uracil phosphoribosyltransferase